MMHNLASGYLFVYEDDEYCEPAGFFTGNLVDIIRENFLNYDPNNYPNGNYGYRIYSMSHLMSQSNKQKAESESGKSERSGFPIISVNTSEAGYSVTLKDAVSQFNVKNKHTTATISNNLLKFVTMNDKIKSEIDNLSPETIEYIKMKGL